MCFIVSFSVWPSVELYPGGPFLGAMSKGRRNQPTVEEEESDDSRSPTGVEGERSMLAMFKLLMEEQRRETLDREVERRREEARREEAKLEREREETRLKEERQKAFEQRQFDQQMAIMKAQIELGERSNQIHRDSQNEDRKRNRVLTGISSWREGDDLEEFFVGIEKKLGAGAIREGEWMNIVDSKLTGKVSIAWQDIAVTAGDYREAKSRLLKVCGYTPKLAADGFYGFKVEQCRGLTADQVYHKGLQLLRRMLAPVKVAEEAEFALLKGWVCHVVPRRARTMLDTRPLGSSTELISALQDFLSSEGDRGDGQAATFRMGHSESQRERGSAITCFKCNRVGHKAADCWGVRNSSGESSGASSASGGVARSVAKGVTPTVVCYTCREEGHKSPQCPRNVKGERAGGKEVKPKPVKRVWRSQSACV